ncbi:MAG: iron ABC transporter permease [Actinomycetaceae bacterium]|nr:iron ABC transporter permease [Actinomycetaceae bacterium]
MTAIATTISPSSGSADSSSHSRGRGAPVPEPGFTSPGRARRRARYYLVTIFLAIFTASLWYINIALGDPQYSPEEIWNVLRGADAPGAAFIVGELRLPRATLALVVGAAFGMAGRASQTMLRNYLASPDIIGINAGASTAAVIAILLFGLSGMTVNIIAVTAGLATALVVFFLSGGATGTHGGRLILIGIGTAAVFSAVTNYVILRANTLDIPKATRWLNGSLNEASWDDVVLVATALLILGASLLFVARDLPALRLGNEAATSLGVHTSRASLGLLIILVALSAFAAATTGPIAFVSFLSGPVTAALIGPTSRNLLGASALSGSALVLGADFLGQYAFPTALPVGVVTGIIGAPYLIAQLVRMNRRGAAA